MRLFCWIAPFACLVAGCALQPAATPDPQSLFDDQGFSPRQVIAADAIFAVDESMQRYLATHVRGRQGGRDRAQRLLRLLNGDGQLRLDYDAGHTRTAAETFADRAGNCLSLTLMTAALARQLDLDVRYYRVLTPDVWLREGDVLLANQHVNLSLESSAFRLRSGERGFSFAVDFLPPEDLERQVRSEIGEATVVAMYYNNRAAEELLAGRVDDAYWNARAALQADRDFVPAYNTLGVVLARAGRTVAAARVLERALVLAPENTQVIANLERTYRTQGLASAADSLATRLREIEPVPPYHYFLAALEAMRRGDHAAARGLLERERRREPYNHEVLFALALVSFNLGDIDQSRRFLRQARDNSTTLRSRALYAAKLDSLHSLQ